MKKRILIAALCLAAVVVAALMFHALSQSPSSAETAEKRINKMQVNRTIGSVEDAYRTAAFAAVCTVEKITATD